MEIRPILSTILRNKTGAILVALQVALSLAILANTLHIVSERRAAAARPSGIADEMAVVRIDVRYLYDFRTANNVVDICGPAATRLGDVASTFCF